MPFSELETRAILEALRGGAIAKGGSYRYEFEIGWSDISFWLREAEEMEWGERQRIDEHEVRRKIALNEPAFLRLLERRR